MYHLTWSQQKPAPSIRIEDVPQIGGILRVWTIIGRCLSVDAAPDLRSAVTAKLNQAITDGSISEILLDWSKIEDSSRRRNIRDLEAKRLHAK